MKTLQTLGKAWLLGRVIQEWAAMLLMVAAAGFAVAALWQLVSVIRSGLRWTFGL